MTLGERKWLRIGTLVALYVAQGIPWGFTAITLPAYLSARDIAISDVLVATTLPYSFKWLLGLLVDSVRLPLFRGRRRPWIILAQLLMALTIGTMLMVGDLETDIALLGQLVLVHTVFNALQDVATDGLAVDLLDPDERGRVNGLLFAAKYVGGVIGGAGLANVIKWSSLNTALLVQVVILLGIMLFPLFVAERNKVEEKPARGREVVRALADAFATRRAFGLALVVLTLTFAQGMLSVISNALFTQELGWSDSKLTELTGGWGLGVGLGGSLMGGWLGDRVGHRRLAMVACLCLAAGWLVFALGESMWRDDGFVYSMAIWEQLSLSVMTVSVVALCMSVVTPTAGASQFAAYMAMTNFSTTLGYSVPQWMPDGWATRDFYFAAVGIQCGCALLFWLVRPSKQPELQPPAWRGYLALGFLVLLLCGLTTYVAWRKLSG